MWKGKLKANIWKLYFVKAARSFMLSMPIIVLFFKENGLSTTDVFVLQALFSFAIIVFELPSGYFSDVFGRKRSLVVGWLLTLFGFGVYCFAGDFWSFLLAELFLGFGASFVSGADSALLYDTLLEMKRESGYKRIEGRRYGFGLISEAIASLLGGFLAVVSLRLPIYCEATVALLAMPIVFSIVEPTRIVTLNKKDGLKKVWQIVKFSLCDQKQIKWLVIYSSLASASTLTMVWFIQDCLKQANLPISAFGFAWMVLMLVSAVVSWYAHDLEKFLGRKKTLISLMALSTVGYFFLGVFDMGWSIVFIVLFYFARGINNPVTSDYINKLVSSDIRATVLSVKSLVGRLIFCILGPMAGWACDAYSLELALMLSGTTFLFLGFVALIFMSKHKAL